VANGERLEVPAKMRLELGAVVGLDDEDPEWNDLVDEVDGSGLGAGVVDLEDANPGAVINRREWIEPLARARNAFQGARGV
jgi:hypothetical protein